MDNSSDHYSTGSGSSSTSHHQTVSGASVTLSSSTGDLSESWFGLFYLRGNHVYRAFETAPAGTFESHVEYALDGEVVERLSVDGGELRLAYNEERLASLGCWRGTWHDVYTWLAGPRLDSSQLVQVFSDIELNDDRRGVRVRRRMPAEVKLYGIRLNKYIPEIAFLTIMEGTDAVDLVPKWAGAQAQFGEVWRMSDDGDESRSPLFLHASQTAVTLARVAARRGRADYAEFPRRSQY
jgi:hypothetical protein